MNHLGLKKYLGLFLTFLFVLPLLTVRANAATPTEIWHESPTGYSKASEVEYVTNDNLVANWGVRGEPATFLTGYAEEYYTDSYTYENLSAHQGNANTRNTPSSRLYNVLSDMMNAKSTSTTSYGETRYLFQYTDCMANDYTHISSFYSGIKLNGKWDGAQTWNREHTWPNSKISGKQETDIMMLRPSCVSENSDRGNTAYGKTSGFYDPNSESDGQFNLHGDCARILLYVYVRWGVTDTMWGYNGVIEDRNVLLEWMEEDPVDTWEMGRNDAVQAITGVRNVFVDYPELAWRLFDQEVPTGYVSPSGGGENGGNVNGGMVTPSETGVVAPTGDAVDTPSGNETVTPTGATADTPIEVATVTPTETAADTSTEAGTATPIGVTTVTPTEAASANTSDDNNIVLWVVLGVMAVLAGGAAMFSEKRST